MRGDNALRVLLSDSTVELPPGGRATIRAEVINEGASAVIARMRVTGRASSWLGPVPGGDVLDVPPRGTRTVTLLAQPPRTSDGGGLVPFALHVEAEGGDRASATGLVVLASGRAVEVSVAPRAVTVRRTAEYAVELRTGGEPGVVALRPGASRTRLRLWLDAPTVAVPRDGTARVGLLVQAARPALLGPVRHDVVVDWEELGGGDAHGSARAVLHQRPLLPAPVTVLVLLLTSVGLLLGVRVALGEEPLPLGLSSLVGLSSGDEPAATPTSTSAPAPGRSVDEPYVHLDVVLVGPDPAASRRTAQERVDQLERDGVPGVRVVRNDEVPGTPRDAASFWVLVRDGFDDVAAAERFCAEHQAAERGHCRVYG